MPHPAHRSARIAVALLALASAPALAAPPPPVCPGGAFVVGAGTPLVTRDDAAQPARDLVAVATVEGAGARAAIASGCPPAAAKLRATRRGTRVTASWPSRACVGTRGRLRLRGLLAPDCGVLRGTVSANGSRRRFTAPRHSGKVSPIVDDARAATAIVSAAAGGSVTATAADGIVYTLTVPPGALAEDTEITMTPLAGLASLPVAADLVAGVRFEPEGLQFYAPARLTADLSAAPSTVGLVGFGAEGGGERFHLDLIDTGDARLTIEVTHFSIVGMIAIGGGVVPVETAIAGYVLGVGESDLEVQGLNELTQLVAQDVRDEDEYLTVLRRWYHAFSLGLHVEQHGVGQALSLFAPQSDEDLRKALRGWVVWKQAIAAASSFIGMDLAPSLDRELAQAVRLAAEALVVAIDRANQACRQNSDLARAHDALRWQATAEKLGAVLPGYGLDLPSVLARLCVQ